MKLLLATFLALSPFVSAAFRDYSFGDESYHLLVSREASRESYRDYSFGDENYNLLVSREAPPELSACSVSIIAWTREARILTWSTGIMSCRSDAILWVQPH